MTVTALSLLAALTPLSLPFWWDLKAVSWFRLRAGLLLALWVAALAAAAWFAVNSDHHTRTDRELAVALSILTSICGGGPVARALLRLADPGTAAAPTGPARANLLTGGAWIGALERAAITTSLLAAWPEGLALVLAVKGLGRYPELHSAVQSSTAAPDAGAGTGTAAGTDPSSAAERFIIGTFASALWAAACAGVGLALLR